MSLLLQDTLVISPATVQKIEQEIEDLKGATDCADVVQNKADLNSYDTSKLTDNAIVKVLQDESRNDAETYYRYSKSSDSFTFIGELGPYYTKSEDDALLAGKVDKTNSALKVYVTDNNGNQGTIEYAANSSGNNTIVRRTNTGTIITATPTDNMHAATKKYVDDADALKVTANTAITGATKAKITYDSKGLVTAGADLVESDIPSLHLTKVTDVTATVTEVNYLSGVTSNVQTQLNNKQYKSALIDISSLSVPLSVADNCIYTGDELATLTLQQPLNALTTDYEAQVNFTSGSTPTVVTVNDPIVWLGDNVNEDTGFQPRANCRYSIVFTYDGVNWCGMIRGVSL